MQYLERKLMQGFALPALAVALVLGGCSGGFEKVSEAMPKASDFTRDFSTFEWNPYSKASTSVAPTFKPPTVTAADFVNPDGSCAGAHTQGAGADGEPTASVPTAATGGPVALQMTECAVVRALGTPERVDLGANERGERKTKLLYSRGDRPGLYSFTAGLLTEVERVEPPEPPKPQKKPPAKPAPRRAT